MADQSKIEWTDATWNPITGCAPVSEGCANCYAKRNAEGRLRGKYGYPQDEPFRVTFHEDKLEQPLKWRRPRKIFVCSMGDLFHEDVPVEWTNCVFRAIQKAPHHRFMVLTKRPERMHDYLRNALGVREWPRNDILFPNLWLGVTAENQQRADERIPVLLDTPAAKCFVSVEPMLGPVDLSEYLPGERWHASECPMLSPLDWVICGGETGANARPMHPDWVRSLRDQCKEAQVPFFFKSWGEWAEVYDRDRDDPDWRRCHARSGPSERYLNIKGGQGFHGERVVFMRRIGKRNAGRLLDGRTWDEEPS